MTLSGGARKKSTFLCENQRHMTSKIFSVEKRVISGPSAPPNQLISSITRCNRAVAITSMTLSGGARKKSTISCENQRHMTSKIFSVERPVISGPSAPPNQLISSITRCNRAVAITSMTLSGGARKKSTISCENQRHMTSKIFSVERPVISGPSAPPNQLISSITRCNRAVAITSMTLSGGARKKSTISCENQRHMTSKIFSVERPVISGPSAPPNQLISSITRCNRAVAITSMTLSGGARKKSTISCENQRHMTSKIFSVERPVISGPSAPPNQLISSITRCNRAVAITSMTLSGGARKKSTFSCENQRNMTSKIFSVGKPVISGPSAPPNQLISSITRCTRAVAITSMTLSVGARKKSTFSCQNQRNMTSKISSVERPVISGPSAPPNQLISSITRCNRAVAITSMTLSGGARKKSTFSCENQRNMTSKTFSVGKAVISGPSAPPNQLISSITRCNRAVAITSMTLSGGARKKSTFSCENQRNMTSKTFSVGKAVISGPSAPPNQLISSITRCNRAVAITSMTLSGGARKKSTISCENQRHMTSKIFSVERPVISGPSAPPNQLISSITRCNRAVAITSMTLSGGARKKSTFSCENQRNMTSKTFSVGKAVISGPSAPPNQLISSITRCTRAVAITSMTLSGGARKKSTFSCENQRNMTSKISSVERPVISGPSAPPNQLISSITRCNRAVAITSMTLSGGARKKSTISCENQRHMTSKIFSVERPVISGPSAPPNQLISSITRCNRAVAITSMTLSGGARKKSTISCENQRHMTSKIFSVERPVISGPSPPPNQLISSITRCNRAVAITSMTLSGGARKKSTFSCENQRHMTSKIFSVERPVISGPSPPPNQLISSITRCTRAVAITSMTLSGGARKKSTFSCENQRNMTSKISSVERPVISGPSAPPNQLISSITRCTRAVAITSMTLSGGA